MGRRILRIRRRVPFGAKPSESVIAWIMAGALPAVFVGGTKVIARADFGTFLEFVGSGTLWNED
jgi:hypothetical protein